MEHTYHTLRQLTQFHVIDGDQAEVNSFRRSYLSENRPCLFASTAVGVDQWRAKKEWATQLKSQEEESSGDVSHCSSSSSSSVSDFHCQLLAAKRLILRSRSVLPTDTVNEAKAKTCSYPSARSMPNFEAILQLCTGMHDPVLIAEIQLPQSSPSLSQSASEQTSSAASSSNQQQIHAYGSNTTEGSMQSFFERWQSTINARAELASSSSPSSVHYLKDWHLCLTHPNYGAYRTPKPLRDDWMNWFHLNPSSANKHSAQLPPHFPSRVSQSDDFRFCYMGERATLTPLHADVYNSYSWSTNIVGRKMWIMFHPDWRPFLTEDSGVLVNDVLAGNGVEISLTQQQLQHIAEKYSAVAASSSSSSPSSSSSSQSSSSSSATTPPAVLPPCYVWIQLEGETLFVPSGWLHQVHNLDDCISINHNWMNACNLQNMYRFLKREWHEAMEAVQGFDFDAGMKSKNSSESAKAAEELDLITVQNASRVMHSSVGMSWEEFYAFLQFHRARLERSSDEELADCALDREFAASSIITIDQAIQQMKQDGILNLIDMLHCEDHVVESSQDVVSSQLGQLTISEAAADTPNTDSEDEFPVRRRRMASNVEGQTRRRRVIREDDDEDETLADYVPDEEDVASVLEEELENGPLCEEQPGLSSAIAPAFLQSSISHVSPCPAPIDSLLGLAPAAATDSKNDETEISDPFAPRQVLSFTLSLYFQQAHEYFQLPLLPHYVLALVSEYAVPTTQASTVSSSVASATPVPTAFTRPRGPFFVVQTHYANGDTFSEEYSTVEELLGGIQMFVEDCWKRIQLVKQESDESLPEVQEALKQLCTNLDAFQRQHPSCSSSSCSSSPSLDEIFEATLALGDAMVEFQAGYGWTFIHECEHNST